MSRHIQICPDIQTYPDMSRYPDMSGYRIYEDFDPTSLFYAIRGSSWAVAMEPCVICFGESGKALSGKRCTSSACKLEYSRRLKAAKSNPKEAPASAAAGAAQSASFLPTVAGSTSSETVTGFTLWELVSVFGQREYDPSKFTPYELRNGPACDREKELAYLAYASFREGNADVGRSPPPTHPLCVPCPQRTHAPVASRACAQTEYTHSSTLHPRPCTTHANRPPPPPASLVPQVGQWMDHSRDHHERAQGQRAGPARQLSREPPFGNVSEGEAAVARVGRGGSGWCF